MSDNEMLYCLIAFILGWLTSRMMGNGFRVGGIANDNSQIKNECVVDMDVFDSHVTQLNIYNKELPSYKELLSNAENLCNSDIFNQDFINFDCTDWPICKEASQ